MNRILDTCSKLGCLFLSIILFFFICFYLVLDIIPKIVIKENIKVVVNEIKTEELVDNNKESLLNDLYQVAEENNIEINIINEVINSKEFKEVINNYYSELVEAILYNKEKPVIKASSLISAIKDALERSVDDMGFAITDENKEIIINYVENNADRIVELVPTYDEVTNSFGEESINEIRVIFGNSVKIILMAIIIIIVLIMVLLRWSIYKFSIWSGVTTILVGLTFMILSSFAYDAILNLYSSTISIALQTLVENNILKVVSDVGIVVVIIGAIQIGYYFIMRKSSINIKY